MRWAALLGPKAVLEAENTRLRRVLEERDKRISELSATLDDALDREQMYSLTPRRERLTPAAVLDRYGQPRAERPRPASTPEIRGAAPQVTARPWMRSLENTVAGTAVSGDRRRSR